MNLTSAIFIFILGGFSFAVGLRLALQNRAWHRRWARSTVTFFKRTQTEYRGPGADPGDRTLQVGYTFRVGNETITSDRILPGAQTATGGIGAAARLERQLSAFPDGMEVRYNPAKPAECALRPNPAWAVWVSTVMGGGFSLFGLLAILADAFGAP